MARRRRWEWGGCPETVNAGLGVVDTNGLWPSASRMNPPRIAPAAAADSVQRTIAGRNADA
jgi:hypothetical protein